MDFKGRRRRALAAGVKAGVEALLVTHAPDVRYLCGFTGSNGAVVLAGGKALLFTDGRYTGQARAEAAGCRVVISKKAVAVAACEWMQEAGVRTCGFDTTHTTVSALAAMRKAAPAKALRSMFVGIGAVVARLREVKEEAEVEIMRRAAAVGCGVFDHMLGFIEAGMTEIEVAAELEYAARKAGAEGMSFETIVASGERSALPHGRASAARLPKRGFVTLDFGVVVEGYASDMTRTVHLGKALPGAWDVYHSVLEAQVAAVEAVGPGVTAEAVDEAARSVLRRDGLDKYFSHSTGHGVGLEIHEGPRLAVKQQQVLEAGMVVTIEPGVYMPEKFGLRIEDMVLVTVAGREVLTAQSVKAWTEL